MSDQIKFWRYYVPNIDGEGWGIFVLDSTGFFSAVTDYGNCAFRWSSTGAKDFREFFKGSSADYYIGKLFGDKRQEYQGDQTLEKIKSYLLEARRDNNITKEDAREEWDLLEQNENLYSVSDFTRWYDETNLNDAGEFYTTDYPASVKAFGKELLPRLFKIIQEELSSEEPVLVLAMNGGSTE